MVELEYLYQRGSDNKQVRNPMKNTRHQSLKTFRDRPFVCVPNMRWLDSGGIIPQVISLFEENLLFNKGNATPPIRASVTYEHNHIYIPNHEVNLEEIGMEISNLSINDEYGIIDFLYDNCYHRSPDPTNKFLRRWVGLGALTAFTEICIFDICINGYKYKQVLYNGISVMNSCMLLDVSFEPYFSWFYNVSPSLFKREYVGASEIKPAFELFFEQGFLMSKNVVYDIKHENLYFINYPQT